ncbi:GNAT family N-acetyltransferase [Halomonas daqingensis]|uniref:GNAT family N-acetyltransferase n=1 Tax=Billgrantia desiderata TaxID=52021 RepID=UPI000A35FC33|nr:GNAT family N-acetyltransferase [Halomonas desiderata]MCE8027825.1 GNAT family N-acetyltransferase [Halomonas desiderata]NIC37890.1 GNAT family N-acetyltransferase [Halomonas desiderata]OUE40981.1 GNAT family N-acetyltransferase [Halomonas desiderata SP1]
MSDIGLHTLKGSAIEPRLDELAHLRITVFRDYPYLYDGSFAYEADYLRRYAECPDSLFVLAEDGDALVGAATGMPLAKDVAEFRAPFEQAGFDVNSVFYYGESVLLPSYRGRGIGKAFLAKRERHATERGFTTVAFCAVERPDDHPLKPAGYVPLHGFWRSQGYERHPELATTFRWKDIGEPTETDKPMVFWLKSLQ